MIQLSFIMDLVRSSLRITLIIMLISRSSIGLADVDVSQGETETSDPSYLNFTDKATDKANFFLSEKEEVDSIVSELHQIRHLKKSKPAITKPAITNADKPSSTVSQSRKLANVNREPEGRLLQAKELMGKEFGSYFKIAKKLKKPDRNIHEYVKEAFADFDKKSRVKAKATSRAILSESKRYGFDPFFLLAIIENESSFNIHAKGDAGEIGLMQILPETAKWICEKNNWAWKGIKTLRDPAQNVKIGAAYLNLLRQQFESESQLYISAYNMGPKNVHKALRRKVTPREYHARVLEFYISYYKQIKKQYEDQRST